MPPDDQTPDPRDVITARLVQYLGWTLETSERFASDLAKLDPDQAEGLYRGMLGHGIGEEESPFPPPQSIGDILAKPEPETPWLAEGLLPAGGNVLLVGYPKSHKTHMHMELAVSLSTGTPFLGRFATEGGLRTGLVLLEGGEREQARRLDRIAQARGIRGKHLDGSVFVWHRPPLRLNDPVAMRCLGEYAMELSLDVLVLDAWAYAAEGSSNEDFTVTPQLMALSRLRDHQPDLTVLLVHHARKTTSDPKGERLTDLIRGSGAFGGWYDCCLVLARKDEESPHVTVRTELREYPSPKSFVFAVEDEEPGQPSNDYVPQGALYLRVSDLSPKTLKVQEKAGEKTEDVLAFLRDTPGASMREIREGVRGRGVVVDAAVELLENEGKVRGSGGGAFEKRTYSLAEGRES